MTDPVNAWQCVGCGRIEAPQTCIGICEYRKVEFVYADEYEELLAETTAARQRQDLLVTLARKLAHTTPRDGQWDRSYRAMQDLARRALAAIADGDAKPDVPSAGGTQAMIAQDISHP
ncbi:MAG: hypothetical protein ABI440_14350 [Casimicrobiaceae bacterium]